MDCFLGICEYNFVTLSRLSWIVGLILKIEWNYFVFFASLFNARFYLHISIDFISIKPYSATLYQYIHNAAMIAVIFHKMQHARNVYPLVRIYYHPMEGNKIVTKQEKLIVIS